MKQEKIRESTGCYVIDLIIKWVLESFVDMGDAVIRGYWDKLVVCG